MKELQWQRYLFHSLMNPMAQNTAQHIIGAQEILVELGEGKKEGAHSLLFLSLWVGCGYSGGRRS